MNEIMHYLLVFAGGILLGIIFYGGLWLTLKKGLSSKFSAVFLFASFLLRSAIALTGFYYLSYGNLTLLVISIVGFIIARVIIIRITNAVQRESYKKERT